MQSGRRRPDPPQDLQEDPAAVLRRSAVPVRPVIDGGGDKAAQEEEMCRMDLNAVKACLLRPDGGVGKLPDDQMDLLFGHVVRLRLLIPPVRLTVKGTQRQLCDNSTALGVNGLGELLILRDQGIVTQTHHPVEAVVVERHAGKAGEDRAHAAPGQLFVNCICLLGNAAVRVCDPLPCGRTDQTVFDGQMPEGNRLKHFFQDRCLPGLDFRLCLYYN